MGLSETILAASIGAAATVTTALFQLFGAIRANNKVDARPKRGRTIRSIIAVMALMIVSAVSGFMFAELRQERTAEDVRSMRDEMNAKLQALTQTTERLASVRAYADDRNIEQSQSTMRRIAQSDRVESTLYAHGCKAGEACNETSGERTSLCGVVPNDAQIAQVELFVGDARPQTPGELFKPDFKRVEFGQDSGGAKFTGPPTELARDDSGKTLCVDFVHWSEQPHIARMVLRLGAISQVDSVSTSAPPVATIHNAALVAQ